MGTAPSRGVVPGLGVGARVVLPCCAVFPGGPKCKTHGEAFGSELAIRLKRRRELESDEAAMNRAPCLEDSRRLPHCSAASTGCVEFRGFPRHRGSSPSYL